MIDVNIEMFLKDKIYPEIRQKFYGKLIGYMEFIVETLQNQKYKYGTEISCAGSAYRHLTVHKYNREGYYVLVMRDEQHCDEVFIINLNDFKKTVTAYIGYKTMAELDKEGYSHVDPKDGSIKFSSQKELTEYLSSELYRLTIKNEYRLTTKEIVNHSKQGKCVFGVGKYKDKEELSIDLNEHLYSFKEELRMFGSVNNILCGVTQHYGLDFPKEFSADLSRSYEWTEPFNALLTPKKYEDPFEI